MERIFNFHQNASSFIAYIFLFFLCLIRFQPLHKMAEPRFHWADYLVLGISLFLSCTVGVYYGIMDQKKKKNTTEDFLMAGRKMAILPVSISMIATSLSATSILGNPVELYYYGVVLWTSVFGIALALPIVAHAIAPIYHRMKVVSANEVKFYTIFFQFIST